MACLRAYLNFFMYTRFELHTEQTIVDGRNEVERFSKLMKVCFLHHYNALESFLFRYRHQPHFFPRSAQAKKEKEKP
jgi:hypothetical protein